MVQTHQVMQDTPYGDCFAVLHKWVLAPPPPAASPRSSPPPGGASAADATPAAAGGAAARGCTLTVSVDLVWSKEPWLKSTITAGAVDEVRASYRAFLPLAKKHLLAHALEVEPGD